MTPRFRAEVRREHPIDVSGLDGKRCVVPAGWRWVVLDLGRLPSSRVVLVGVRGSQPEAIEAACAQIKRCSGGGR